MSAYMCDAAELAPIVGYAVAYGLPYRQGVRGYVKATAGDADHIGRMLQAENLRSLRARYNRPVDVAPYVHAKPGACDAVAMLHKVRDALDTYEYQACEAIDWHASDAASLCNAVRRKLLDGFAARVRR